MTIMINQRTNAIIKDNYPVLLIPFMIKNIIIKAVDPKAEASIVIIVFN